MSPQPPFPTFSTLRHYATTRLPPPRPTPSSPRPKTTPSSILLNPAPTSSKLTFAHTTRLNPRDSSPDRIYTPRKAFLYQLYTHLLRRSAFVLLFTHDNLSVLDTNRLRAAIQRVPLPALPSPIPKTRGRRKQESPARAETAQLTVTRTGVFAALARSMHASTSLAPFLEGQTAILTCPTLSPTYLGMLLRSINRSVAASKRPEIRDKVVKQPYFRLVAGVLEGNRLVGVDELARVGKLPEMDAARAQVVGLLEGAGREVVGVLGQAGGGGLMRTLHGLEETLSGQSPAGEAETS